MKFLRAVRHALAITVGWDYFEESYNDWRNRRRNAH